MNILVALVSGLVFGAGLILSGMSDPAKVFGFLDVAGQWDPSLVFVMAGGIGVAVLPFALAARLQRSWLGQPIVLPEKNGITRHLLIGSAVFGVGWGLAGICPGPALISLGSGYLPGVIFAMCMFLGMEVNDRFTSKP
jgi:uncharacterized protein